MLLTVPEASPWSVVSLARKSSSKPRNQICRAALSVETKQKSASSWKFNLPFKRYLQQTDGSVFDPLGLNVRNSSGLNGAWESIVDLFSPVFVSTSGTRKDRSSTRGVAAAIEDSSIDIGDFFKGPLPGKFLKLLGYLALSRLGIYIPLGGVNREAFVGNLDQNSLLSTLDSFSGGGIGRLGICSLGIVPFINAQIVFQLLAQIYPKLQDLQKREGEAGRKKILQYTRYASVGFAVVQEAERKIPLNYASRYSMRNGGLQRSAYLPFKVNSSGVMPIIFSTSSLALPGTLARFTGLAALKKAALTLNPGGSLYLPTNILLIAFFNYYYTFLQLDPDDVSEQLKRQGASIPLVRPGKSTAAFIKTVLSRISVLGSAFLAILAAGPAVVEQITHLTAFRGFAGTSVLILVGCATDTARKVQAEIISQKYTNIEFYDLDKFGDS
ncbi:preprotein translocase subunit SCY1, chloroplastic isoform X2 [Aristolochia californica]|uniref:preprotein translocase subunit SCY1, chloroplastic isoform X2 n=1 Tax=Aristolochia californica TaxID=171875 RepID=UPI0035D7711F